jgi:uncharacterized membrane protein
VSKQRLEAFTDGVMAIIITIMVLEIKVPAGADLTALRGELPILLAYALSFANVGIFWNNHHHMLHATERINGMVLWANLLLLFWLSLMPFMIRWMDDTSFASLPTASYGVDLVLCAVSYILLQRSLVKCNGPESKLARAVGAVDLKSIVSLLTYLAAIPLAFVHPWISLGLYIVVAMVWFIPDRRIESIR